MVFVSSSCFKGHSKIATAVSEMVSYGIENIELSGGTEFYPEWKTDLQSLQQKYDLCYQLHNYFPAPQEHFVLNLASLDTKIFSQSFEHVQRALAASEFFGAEKFALHAGFYMDIAVSEIGKIIKQKKLVDKDLAIATFSKAFLELQAKSNVKLYVENNVVAGFNYDEFGCNPLMLTCSKEVIALQEQLDFSFLLDVAHLKVSCQTLGLDFAKELATLWPLADYIHLSDNDGSADQNLGIQKEATLWEMMKEHSPKGKTFTIEVYDKPQEVLKSKDLIEEWQND